MKAREREREREGEIERDAFVDYITVVTLSFYAYSIIVYVTIFDRVIRNGDALAFWMVKVRRHIQNIFIFTHVVKDW